MKWQLAIAVLGAAFVVPVHATDKTSQATSSKGPASELIPLDDDDRLAVAAAVKDQLKDPDFAQFRWLPASAEDGTYCGMVNSRNSYGGYVGFTPFIVTIFRLKNPDEVKALILAIGDGGATSPRSRSVTLTCGSKGFDPSLAR